MSIAAENPVSVVETDVKQQYCLVTQVTVHKYAWTQRGYVHTLGKNTVWTLPSCLMYREQHVPCWLPSQFPHHAAWQISLFLVSKGPGAGTMWCWVVLLCPVQSVPDLRGMRAGVAARTHGHEVHCSMELDCISHLLLWDTAYPLHNTEHAVNMIRC